ncbi:phage tail protein [Paenibacillus koleovorans]|uniref:phage tail protein n=1 Tax=Paenibacillus koleovorans TaxID=121608 RepID=UPI000FD888F9|nr:tail fiber protein [Paenibacillus koleovorans]
MSDQYLGEIRLFSGNYAPQGWAMCNGQILSISENEALYTLIGATYGGDGRTTFGLPDLRGRIPLHTGTNTSTGTVYSIGQKGGVETVILTTAQLPAHTHQVSSNSLDGTSVSPTNGYFAGSSVNQYSTLSPNAMMNAAAISSVGGNQSHNNMMPFNTLTYIIALQGIFPSPA